jgi:hypothetical protein
VSSYHITSYDPLIPKPLNHHKVYSISDWEFVSFTAVLGDILKNNHELSKVF